MDRKDMASNRALHVCCRTTGIYAVEKRMVVIYDDDEADIVTCFMAGKQVGGHRVMPLSRRANAKFDTRWTGSQSAVSTM